ncbi:DUF4234 domain-containing protein [Modestobacter sp. NPDC049651]|uniref:DUF4234 domain-containing protein n=1 Tax=unclassified Modestobacter TaxID=2643866 RepID=UPI0033D90CE0
MTTPQQPGPDTPPPPQYGRYAPPPQGQYGQYAPPQPAGWPAPMPQSYDQRPPMGPVGKVRGTWAVIGLTIITFGIYSLVYYYLTHEEIKKHTGEGLGGPIALLIAFFVGFVSPFLLSHEVGNLYARHGRPQPVTALNGLWVVPGCLILVGPFIWLFQTNGALNDYWRSVGAR